MSALLQHDREMLCSKLFHSSPVAIALTTMAEGRYLDVNDTLLQLLGYRRDELLGRSVFDLNVWVHTDERARLIQDLQEQGTIRDREIQLRTRSGTIRDVSLAIERVDLDAQACLLTLIYDITAWKQTVEQLHRHTLRARTLAEISKAFAEVSTEYETVLDLITRQVCGLIGEDCCIRLLSDDGQWLDLLTMQHDDPEHTKLLRSLPGIARRSIHERPFDQVIPSGQALLIPEITSAQLHGLVDPVYLPYLERFAISSLLIVPLRARGTILGVLDVSRSTPGNPYTIEDQTFLQDLADRAALAIANARLYQAQQHELAARQRAEEALRQERALLAQRVEERTAKLSAANAQLARAARLKDEFLANMSHELRTPLSVILGQTESLAEEIYGPLTAQQRKLARMIEESGRQLLALINDILDIAQIEAGKVELDIQPVEVKTICQASLQSIKLLSEQKRLAVNVNIDPAVSILAADGRRLKQILTNLLSNAARFTPNGGQIGLDVCGDITHEVIRFTVWDTGIGIASEAMEYLFEPFVQLDSGLSRAYAGTGLGLSLVRRLADMHGGSVILESSVGQGSRFTVALPWHPGDRLTRNGGATGATLPTPPHPANSCPDPQPTILLAEDNELNIITITDYLQSQGYRVVVARNGIEAIERVRETRPNLILMDIQMPEMDGRQATRHIRADADLSTTPIIALTALTMPGDRERCLAAGADDYLSKPVSLDDLLQTIEAHLRRVRA